MLRKSIVVGALLLTSWLASPASAQDYERQTGYLPVPPSPQIQYQDYTLNRMFYYPYYNFPHNYWPQQQDPYPERIGEPYRKPPAYMSYPAFHEPHWRYELWQPMSYYRGFHFWLDQF